jgi:hypothetical protein
MPKPTEEGLWTGKTSEDHADKSVLHEPVRSLKLLTGSNQAHSAIVLCLALTAREKISRKTLIEFQVIR